MAFSGPCVGPSQQSHQSSVRLTVLKLMAHGDGWFAVMSTSSLNALLLTLLSALTC